MCDLTKFKSTHYEGSRGYIFMAILNLTTIVHASANNLINVLTKYQNNYALVLPEKYQRGRVYILDISKNSNDFKDVDIFSSQSLIKHSNQLRKSSNADMLIGRYLEDRDIYKRGDQYKGQEESRSVHLGQDLMVPAGTKVYAPLDGKVHSFKDNNDIADYGPTIILEHTLDGIRFYTLYGHLSRSTLLNLKINTKITKGQQIATIGKPFENGGWPEHLHFQIIDDMQGELGNFKGVIEPSKKDLYAKHCPDPNIILNIDALKVQDKS